MHVQTSVTLTLQLLSTETQQISVTLKLQLLHLNNNKNSDKKEVLLERELVLEEISALTARLRARAGTYKR
jgi:hypothetical protein